MNASGQCWMMSNEFTGAGKDMIVLVVDVQKGITDERLYAFETFIDRTARLIGTARKNDVEVIYFQQNHYAQFSD